MLPYGKKTPLPFPFSLRSHVGNLRQTIQGKGEKIRGWKPQVSTLLCPCRAGKPMLNVCKACVLTQFLLTVPCKNNIIKMYANCEEIMKMIM